MALESIKEAEKLHGQKINFSAGTKAMTNDVLEVKSRMNFNDEDFVDSK